MLKYYLTLQVPFPATDQEIRAAYLELVKRYTPERNPDGFARITEAYEALRDGTRRLHAELSGFVGVNYPEEEIILLGRLSGLSEGRIGLRDLMGSEKRSSRET